ncbi:PucR family transcriptional regulator [Lentzea aerocolonigenes]|uniref:PucR family transcriptional regulator n=1 Tax=Lentzea aerocolonigenes TaxID=68170 RepID=UPI0004C3A819|nr:helix-turn-helix domain-containing protein [Lentzea aerocolonigenes]
MLAVCLAALPQADHSEAEVVAGVREIGALWARSGGRVDDLLSALNAMAAELDGNGAPCHDGCERLVVELERGFRPAAPEPVLTPEGTAAVFAVDGGSADVVAAAFQRSGRSDVTCVVVGDRAEVLLPSRGEQAAVHECEVVLAKLPGWSIRAAVASEPDGLAAASRLLGIAVALDLPDGVYGRADLLIEGAVARSRESSAALRRLITPVMESHSLRTTLAALIAEGGNRTGAAERLIIHRSTIDYRLARIEQLTGQSPLTVRGLQVLTTAYALCS